MPKYDFVLPPITINEISVKQASQVYDWGHKYMGATDIYSITRGQGVAIAILDTAGKFEHEDLLANALNDLGKNFSNSSSILDLHGHGHLCAGCASAVDNAIGVIGIAPESKIIPVKVITDNGGAMESWINNGIKYVADLDIPYKKVISLSLGGPGYSTSMEEAITYAINKGCIVVVAAGNSGQNNEESTVNTPGNITKVITVGAIDKDETVAYFSSRGKELDVVAPGVNIYSTWRNNLYIGANGTSFSTPLVAGLVALLISAYPKNLTTQEQVQDFLTKYAKDLGKQGFDTDTGFGSVITKNYMNKFNDDPTPDPNPTPIMEDITNTIHYTLDCVYRDHVATFNSDPFKLKGHNLNIDLDIIFKSSDTAYERDLDRLQAAINAKVMSFYNNSVICGKGDTALIEALSKIQPIRLIKYNNCNIKNLAQDLLDEILIAVKDLKIDFQIKSLSLKDEKGRTVKILPS